MTHDGFTPSAPAGAARSGVRRRRASGLTPPPDARGTWLATPADFDYTRTLGFLNPRSVPAMERTTPARYVRTVWLAPGALRALAGASGASGAIGAHEAAGAFEFSGAVTLAIEPAAALAVSSVTGALVASRKLAPDASTVGASDGSSTESIDSSRAVATRASAQGASPAGVADGLLIASAPLLPDFVRRLLVTRMFDLDADLDAFFAAVSRDRVLGPLVRRQPPLRLPQVLDPFEGLVRAVLGQQVTVKAATTMVDRLVRRFGTPAPALTLTAPLGLAAPVAPFSDAAPFSAFANASGGAARKGSSEALDGGAAAIGGLTDAEASPAAPIGLSLMAFPRPEAIAGAGDETLRAIGLTRAKAATLTRIAQAVCDGRLDCVRLRTRDAEETQAALVALPGIGPWTASYVRMRALGDRDAFPVADLGVIKALEARGVPRDRHAAVAERWRPWRAYATLHLWQSLSAG